MKNTKTLLLVGVIIVILVGGIYTFNKYNPQSDSSLTQHTTNKEILSAQLTNADFVWRVEKASNWEETMPRHIVHLDVQGKSYKVGESIGCDTKNGPDEANEITRKLCWFGGGGDVYSVFNENGTFIVKHKWIQESGGPEVNASPEGPWETVLKIN